MRYDKEKTVVEFFEFGALSGIEHIFECERMDLKSGAGFGDGISIAQVTDIEPEYRTGAGLLPFRQFGKSGFIIQQGVQFSR